MRLPGTTAAAVAALMHRSANVRAAAAEELGESGDLTAIAPLIAAFGDPEGRVSGFAARSLSAFGAQAVPPLAATLSDPKRVYWASLAIRYIGPPAVPALQQRVLTGDDRGALAAAALLGDLGDARAVGTLKQALARRSNADFQFAASSSLQRLQGSAAPS